MESGIAIGGNSIVDYVKKVDEYLELGMLSNQ